MQPTMPSMPSEAGPVSPPMMQFAGHPDTPLTSQENAGFQMPVMPFYDTSVCGMMPFDINQMVPMGLMNPLMYSMYLTETPSTSFGMEMVTPKTNDSGVSSLESNSPLEESEVYKRVQGRLSLVNNVRQFTVSKDEIERRLHGPEYMNSSTLAALLRKAKTKDGGPLMREDLKKMGIEMPNNRKKSVAHTCFSALLEEEAVLAAKELTGIAHNCFPTDAMAQEICLMATDINRNGSAEKMQELQKDAFHTARFLKQVMHLSSQVQVPICGRRVTPVNDSLHQGMYLFSALTHGFGIDNHKTWLSVFAQMADRVVQTMGVPPST